MALFLFAGQKMQAQVAVEAKMDTNLLLIGDTTSFHVAITYPKDVHVQLPFFADTVIDKLEILEQFPMDTTEVDGRMRLHQRMLVTCFDSGWYTIPPVPFEVQWANSSLQDQVETKPFYFGVVTMPLDTANVNAITDIKKPLDAPLTFKEVAPFAGGFLGLLALAFIAFVLFKRLAKKEPVFVKKEKPKEPAHIIAIRQLDALKEAKIWQKGEVKTYYSSLTDIVRTYLEDRFEVGAMELTTDEIMDEVRLLSEIAKDKRQTLQEVLTRADFIKFAKGGALPEENEQSMQFAYDFVETTKVVPEQAEVDKVEDKDKVEVEKENKEKTEEHSVSHKQA